MYPPIFFHSSRRGAVLPLLLLLLLTPGGRTRAQEGAAPPAPANLYWGDIGIGGGRYGGGIAGAFVKTGEADLFALRAAYMEEIRLCIFGPCSTPAKHHAELAGLYGRIAKGRWGSLSAAGGAALTFVRGEGSADRPTIGFPFELQAFVTPLSFFGLGLTATANVNPQEIFGGAFLTLQIGSLR